MLPFYIGIRPEQTTKKTHCVISILVEDAIRLGPRQMRSIDMSLVRELASVAAETSRSGFTISSATEEKG